MRKISVTVTLALLLISILGSTVAYAAYNWCPDDPKISIDGETVTVLYGLDHPDPAAVVTGPVRVKVYVPKDADAYVSETGGGWGHGEEVEIINKGNFDDEVEVRVRVPTVGKFPVTVSVTAPDDSETCEGQSNGWVKCVVKL
jgi:hypothetical protein